VDAVVVDDITAAYGSSAPQYRPPWRWRGRLASPQPRQLASVSSTRVVPLSAGLSPAPSPTRSRCLSAARLDTRAS